MIWVVGARGLLGSDLGRALTAADLPWVGTGREVDITDPSAVEDFARGKPIDWVVNCAAYTAVDRAEAEPAAAARLNSDGPACLARWAADHRAALVHLSTDYVFSADGPLALAENAERAPQGAYGRTKAQGEDRVRQGCPRHYILRTSWLYGARGPNFVTTMVRLMRQRDQLGVVADQWGSPTWTRDLSEVIVALVRRGGGDWGTYHASGEGHCTWQELAQAILEESQARRLVDPSKVVLVEPLTTAQFGARAPRPRWSVLSKEKLRAVFELSLPPWRASLGRFLDQEPLDHTPRTLLVTGGAGFIGGNFIRYLFDKAGFAGKVVNFDKLTYAGNLLSLKDVVQNHGERYAFVRGDVADPAAVEDVFLRHGIDTVVHFAAETHVDRSILGPGEFVRTNIQGTATLLEAARRAWGDRRDVRFHHVSTDEVFGSLGPSGQFLETTAYDPRSPYSASKAASDHLVRAWFHTYGLPVTLTHCSNNYGPYQFPEKLIPLMIGNLLAGSPLPVYGDGQNVRDWLSVEDHASALWTVVTRGRTGEAYNVGGESEWTNLDLVRYLCRRLAEIQGSDPADYLDLVTFVKDRPGHDQRYAIDCTKLKSELGWHQSVTFEQGLDRTLRWYLDNQNWVRQVSSGEYLTREAP